MCEFPLRWGGRVGDDRRPQLARTRWLRATCLGCPVVTNNAHIHCFARHVHCGMSDPVAMCRAVSEFSGSPRAPFNRTWTCSDGKPTLSVGRCRMPSAVGVHRLSPGQRWALAASTVLALGLAGYGVAGSYETISDLATDAGVPLPGLVPMGIDGGLVGVVTLDLVLAWTGQPVGWLRQLARVLTVGTVAANASAGWPEPIAVGLHSAAPIVLLVMVEAGRAVLLRRAGLMSGIARDRIPWGRWVLSPSRTLLLWRRMVLWDIRSYSRALDIEARLRRAHALLRMHYGRRWKHDAPADLVWMLRTGAFAGEACARVDALIDRDGPQWVHPCCGCSGDGSRASFRAARANHGEQDCSGSTADRGKQSVRGGAEDQRTSLGALGPAGFGGDGA
jgi:uncharacterized protein DUF2637